MMRYGLGHNALGNSRVNPGASGMLVLTIQVDFSFQDVGFDLYSRCGGVCN